MADTRRGERLISIFIHLIKNPKRSYTVTNLMEIFDIPEKERRNVQRAMQDLVALPGKFVVAEGSRINRTYKSGLSVIDKLALPDFENTLLNFVFLQRIANIYPGSAELIDDLVEKIKENVPASSKDKCQQMYSEMRDMVKFMGRPQDFSEDAAVRMNTILSAIRSHHEIETLYKNNIEPRDAKYLPLKVVIYQNEIYIACKRHSTDDVFAIKFRRILKVKETRISFSVSTQLMEKVNEYIRDVSLFDRDVTPQEVVIEFPKDRQIYVEEKPFHQTLKIKDAPNGKIIVSMNVCPGYQLKQWILGHSEYCTVLKPQALRDEMRETARLALERYK